MGFKTYTCVICGESVTKRNSYVHGDGRACRTHEEVIVSQKEIAECQVNRVLDAYFAIYKGEVGVKTPKKDVLTEWLQTQTNWTRSMVNEIATADKDLKILKGANLITLHGEVTEEFVTKFMALIETHKEDTDWVKKTHKPNQNTHTHHHKPSTKKDDDKEVRFRVKERRGAKEAPRRKPSPKR